MAFALPCCAIVLCYARIFYIVRKAALKLQENQLKIDSSVRLPNNHPTSSVKRHQRNGKTLQKLSTDKGVEESPSPSTETDISLDGLNKEQKKKFLSKNKEEDLKFIDTSVESDLPPTLSQLQRKSVQILIHDNNVADRNDELTNIPIEIDQLNLITQNSFGQRAETKKDAPVDSVAKIQASSSGIDLPSDKEILERYSFLI